MGEDQTTKDSKDTEAFREFSKSCSAGAFAPAAPLPRTLKSVRATYNRKSLLHPSWRSRFAQAALRSADFVGRAVPGETRLRGVLPRAHDLALQLGDHRIVAACGRRQGAFARALGGGALCGSLLCLDRRLGGCCRNGLETVPVRRRWVAAARQSATDCATRSSKSRWISPFEVCTISTPTNSSFGSTKKCVPCAPVHPKVPSDSIVPRAA